MNNILEICCDSSMKTFEDTGRIFTCSGAICINTDKEVYKVSPDSTNNRGELLAVYLAVKLAEETMLTFPNAYTDIYIYSDSQFAVFGLRDWMVKWSRTMDHHGVIYGSNGLPVKNQNMFMMIITYCVTHNLKIHFFNQKGHVNTNSPKQLAQANAQFKNANGYLLKPEEIFKISFYNDIVDKRSRFMLDDVNQFDYPILEYSDNQPKMCRYVVPKNFKDYIV